MPSLMHTTQAADAPPCNTNGALPPFTLFSCSQSNEYAFHPLFYPYDLLASFFTSSLIPSNAFLYILAIFLPVFCHISVVFMPFLRSSSFANPLLFDKSAFYLTINQCHKGGRREAEGKQNGGMTYSQPSLASCSFCILSLPNTTLQR